MPSDKWRIVHDSAEHGIWLDGPVRQEVSPWSRAMTTYPVCDRMTFTRPRHIQVMRAEDIVAMAKDAARYRHLRDNWPATIVDALYGRNGELAEAAMDDLIDAEMKEQE